MKYKIKVFINRIITLRKSLLVILFLFLLTIIFIEFWLIDIPASSDFFYHLGQFSLKISYAYVAAFLFYFLTVHIPKEKKRSKSYLYLNNRLVQISKNLNDIIVTILMSSNYKFKNHYLNFKIVEIKKEVFLEECKKIDPLKKVTVFYSRSFIDWFEYLTFEGKNIKKRINELFIFNDSLNGEILERLTLLSDRIDGIIYEDIKLGNKNLEHLTGHLH